MGRRRASHLRTGHAWLLVWLLLAPVSLWAETLQVGSASSLREVVERMAADFEAAHPGTEIRVGYGASSVLAAQLRAGAPLDVLLLADPRIASELAEPDAEPATVFARNELIVLVREGMPALSGPAALGTEKIRRFAIPAPAVPVGRYAREWLRRHDLEPALATRSVQTEHARATLLAVDQGHVDAAIVYATDARLARHASPGYRIPAAEQPNIEYVALLSPEPGEQALARRWLDFLTGETAADILQEAGFLGVAVPAE